MTDDLFILPHDTAAETAITALAAGCATEPEESTSFRRRYFDSFDWRLHRAGLALVHEDGYWRLQRLADHAVEAEAPAAGDDWPRFAGDFPAAGRLRKRLAKLLKMRAVIHLVSVAGELQVWRVLNADRKTVLRLELTEFSPEGRSAAPLRVVALRPLRGYEAPVDAARREAAALGLGARDGAVLDAFLGAVGIEAESYSSKFHARLEPGQDALAAAVVVARTLLDTMRRNEAGVRKDIDTEFLHDFRVAVRRLRSALGIFGEAFDGAALAPFKREFAALGRLTGPLRDLDVYLLDEDRFRGLLPPALAGGLDPLFADLREQRRRALAEVRLTLDSPAYGELTASWEAFLAAPPPGPAAEMPVLELARRTLAHRHQRLVRKGGAIGRRSPDAALHRLRIQGKKLRYLLEFFASLFPDEHVDELVGHLKGLQDNLGEFNDLSVQQELLGTALAELNPRRRSSLAEASALGGLLTALAGRQRVVRGDFAAAFAAFTAGEVADRFAALTGADKETQA